MRLALGIEYFGKNYIGWQKQKYLFNSLQAVVDKSLSRIANQSIYTICAGRTDAGVHASFQVVHFDTNAKRTERQWVFGCNNLLPNDVRVIWSKTVDPEFHARYSATHRYYKYIVYNYAIRPSILNDYVYWYYYPLQESLMQAAAQYWIGTHDFTSFRAKGCQSKSPKRHISSFKVKRQGEIIILDIAGSSFLYRMVRNMIGVLLKIGKGDKPINWSKQVLLAQNRKAGTITVPAKGLYLVGVDYPKKFKMPISHNKTLWFLKDGIK